MNASVHERSKDSLGLESCESPDKLRSGSQLHSTCTKSAHLDSKEPQNDSNLSEIPLELHQIMQPIQIDPIFGQQPNLDENEIRLSEITFNPLVFIKFLIMNLLFFFLLGPFIVILSPIFGINVLRNQGFFGWNRRFLIHTLQYVVGLCYVLDMSLLGYIGQYGTEYYMIIIVYLFRMITIASRYAYLDNDYIKLLYKTTLSESDILKEDIRGAWRIQTDEIIEEELKISILRLDIDSSIFFLRFLRKTPQELQKLEVNRSTTRNSTIISSEQKPLNKLTSHWIGIIEALNKENNKEKKSLHLSPVKKGTSPKPMVEIEANKQSPTNLEAANTKSVSINLKKRFYKSVTDLVDVKKPGMNYISGYTLSVDMMIEARRSRLKHVGKFIFIVSVVRAFLPTGYRIYLKMVKDDKSSIWTDSLYITIPIFLFNIYYFWLSLSTLCIAISDTFSKIYCLRQMGYLINPKKRNYFSSQKIYPAIDIFDPMTIKAWYRLRRVVSDYGKSYILRNGVNVSIMMLIYIFILAIVVLQLVGVFKRYDNHLLLLVLIYEIVVFYIILLIILIGTAIINNQFKRHKHTLTNDRFLVSDFSRLSHLYAGKNAVEPKNQIYKDGLRLLREELGDTNFGERLRKRINVSIMAIDDVIMCLGSAQINEALSVLKIKVNFTIVKTIIIGTVSGVFAIIQIYLNK